MAPVAARTARVLATFSWGVSSFSYKQGGTQCVSVSRRQCRAATSLALLQPSSTRRQSNRPVIQVVRSGLGPLDPLSNPKPVPLAQGEVQWQARHTGDRQALLAASSVSPRATMIANPTGLRAACQAQCSYLDRLGSPLCLTEHPGPRRGHLAVGNGPALEAAGLGGCECDHGCLGFVPGLVTFGERNDRSTTR